MPIQAIKANNFTKNGIEHGFFMRHGGVSIGNFSSLNISFAVDDNPLYVIKNRNLLKSYFNTTSDPIMPNLVHRDDLLVVDRANLHTFDQTYLLPGQHQHLSADAIITDLPGTVIGIAVADCVPVMFYATDIKSIAIVHSGWRSSILQISKKTLSYLQTRGAKMHNIIAALGPSIGLMHYEVKEDFYETFIRQDPNSINYFLHQDKKYYFDNKAYIHNSIAALGVDDIENINIDTFVNHDFFSYRRHAKLQGNTGRFAAMIKLPQK